MPQRSRAPSGSVQQGGPQDSDDEVDAAQLWDPQHQVGHLSSKKIVLIYFNKLISSRSRAEDPSCPLFAHIGTLH